MGTNTNIGQDTAITVYGNPESFKKLITVHGQRCKIKQAIVCPCVGANHGSADYNCEICGGDGYIYTYQRRFLVTDEDSRSAGKIIYPYWLPLLSVVKVENLTSEAQGGIAELEVTSFSDSEITLTQPVITYEKKRVTYYFDGWTHIAREKLRVDLPNKIMYADGTIATANYSSGNPLRSYADIAQVVRIWNDATGKEITDYKVTGNEITTTQVIDADNMYIEYYYSDLTQVILTDVANKQLNEVFVHDIESGECKMAFYPFWELSKGDLIVLTAMTLQRNETLQHQKNMDRLHEIEIFSLNDKILDQDGNIYGIDADYILQGRYVKWIGNKPAVGKIFSVRYGYKPSYVVFEDNPQGNSAENKMYPIIVLARSWSKTNAKDVAKLLVS